MDLGLFTQKSMEVMSHLVYPYCQYLSLSSPSRGWGPVCFWLCVWQGEKLVSSHEHNAQHDTVSKYKSPAIVTFSHTCMQPALFTWAFFLFVSFLICFHKKPQRRMIPVTRCKMLWQLKWQWYEQGPRCLQLNGYICLPDEDAGEDNYSD